MTNKKEDTAIEAGLRLPHSKASLAYIRLKDLDLYDAIMEANKTHEPKRRNRKK